MPVMCATSSINSPPIMIHRMREQLDYAAPRYFTDLADMVMPGRDKLSVLILGCGTGLAGLAFRSLRRPLEWH